MFGLQSVLHVKLTLSHPLRFHFGLRLFACFLTAPCCRNTHVQAPFGFETLNKSFVVWGNISVNLLHRPTARLTINVLAERTIYHVSVCRVSEPQWKQTNQTKAWDRPPSHSISKLWRAVSTLANWKSTAINGASTKAEIDDLRKLWHSEEFRALLASRA